MVNHKIKFLL
jgi:hypothetical protein